MIKQCCPLVDSVMTVLPLLQFASALAKYVEDEKMDNLRVWTSLLKRTIQTTVGIDAPMEHWKALNEIDAVSRIANSVLILFRFLGKLHSEAHLSKRMK